MPVKYIINVNENTTVGVWRIAESTNEMESIYTLNKKERTVYSKFLNVTRKKQWLAYRILLSHMLNKDDPDISYDINGKPYLENTSQYISVTHAGDYAGVILSENYPVGIDIEKIAPRVLRVKDKFLNEKELAFLDDPPDLRELYIYWGAKEALYKLYGKRDLDFRKNILLEKVDISGAASFPGFIGIGSYKRPFFVHFKLFEEYVLVYTIDTMKNS